MPPGNPPPDSAHSRFLALGDSYTIGEGVAPADRWPARLTELLRARGTDLGRPAIIARTGWTTGELSAAIDAADPRGPFELVTLMIGVNNQFRDADPEAYRTEFAALLRRAVRFAGDEPSRVLVLSIPDWGVTPYAAGRDRARIAAGIDRFNAINREETRRAGARYVDVTPTSRAAAGDREHFAADGLHPSGKMHAQWAELALPEALAALGTRR